MPSFARLSLLAVIGVNAEGGLRGTQAQAQAPVVRRLDAAAVKADAQTALTTISTTGTAISKTQLILAKLFQDEILEKRTGNWQVIVEDAHIALNDMKEIGVIIKDSLIALTKWEKDLAITDDDASIDQAVKVSKVATAVLKSALEVEEALVLVEEILGEIGAGQLRDVEKSILAEESMNAAAEEMLAALSLAMELMDI